MSRPRSLQGSVALVTGASSGIGKALARRLAEDGLGLVLVARDHAALTALAQELTAQYGVKATVIAMDLTQRSAPAAIFQATEAAGITVDVLVNNAGFGVHGPFATTTLAHETAMVDVQLSALLGLTKLYLAGMLARRRGYLLTVGSVYSFVPVPFQAVYGACKAFMLSFSEALANETRGQGISISVCCPGTTKTEFRKRAGARDKGHGLSPEAVADVAYRGLLAGKRVTVPGGWEKIFVLLVTSMPRRWLAGLMRIVNYFRLRRNAGRGSGRGSVT